MSSITRTSSPVRSSCSAKLRSIKKSAIRPRFWLDSPALRQAARVRIACRFGAVRATGLTQNAAYVVRSRVLADVQRAADLPVRPALRDQAQDLRLARGQDVGAPRHRPPRR